MAFTVSFEGAVLGGRCHGILALFPTKVMVMRHIIVSFLVVLSLFSASCSLPSLKPYKMDIQQGNVVTSKMMLQLRPGMSKSQVRFIMGTPLIQDSFHSNRWDYFYQMRKAGKIIEQRRVILDFEKEALLRVRGDVIPAGSGDGVAEPTTGTEPVSQPEDKKSLIDKLKFWKKDDKATPEPQTAPPELVAPGSKKPAETQEPANAEQPAAGEEVPSVIAIPPGQQSAPTLESIVPEPAPENKQEPAPATAPEPIRAPEPITDPAEPTPQMPAPAKAEEPAAAPVTPEPAAEPAPQPAPEPEAKPVEKPVAKPVEKAEPVIKPEPSKPTAVPATEKEPPKEDEPGYFEYMLEKIGF